MIIPLIDTHAHLDYEKFDKDREVVIERAFRSGLDAIFTVGTNLNSWKITWQICEAYPAIFPIFGYHPNELNEINHSEWSELEGWLHSHRPMAIGEIGLDYYWDTVEPKRQANYFRKQIHLAQRMSLPIVIHCRDAYTDCLKIIREEYRSMVRGVMHCFSGDPRIAAEALELGFHLSFGGPLTYKKSEPIREAARITPLDRLLVETDCPFLAPQAMRGKRNEPSFVRFTAEKLSEIRGISIQELAAATTKNAKCLFQLGERK